MEHSSGQVQRSVEDCSCPSYPGCCGNLYPFPRAPVLYLPPTPKVVTPLMEALLEHEFYLLYSSITE